MKILIRKFRLFAIIAGLSCTQVALSSKAHAFAGLGLAVAGGSGVPLLVLGGVLFGGAALIGSAGSGGTAVDFVALLGLILLDSDVYENLNFAEISTSQAQEMNVSAEEASSYNQELDKINLVREQIQSELYTAVQNGEKVDFSIAHEKWEQYKAHISPAAYAVLEKISSKVVENLKSNI
jgi:hypothetical protein